jgi:hypothetical protein
MRTFLSIFEMMINSKIWRFNKSIISFRLDSTKMKIEMRTKINDDSTSSCKNAAISAQFSYLSDKRLARVILVWVWGARSWFTSSGNDSVDWTLLVSLRWWYNPSQYTVWCSLLIKWDTRFHCYLIRDLYKCVNHIIHANFMRSEYLSSHLIDKIFCSHTEVTLKMMKLFLFLIFNLLIYSLDSLTHF